MSAGVSSVIENNKQNPALKFKTLSQYDYKIIYDLIFWILLYRDMT